MPRKTLILIFAGGMVLFLGMGTRQSFGLFLAPMSVDLDWGRGVFAFGIALQNLLWGISQPFLGMFADKYGAARSIAIGGVFYAAGLVIMAISTSPWQFHLGAGLFVGMGLSAASFAVVMGAVARAAPPERRSTALGVTGMIGAIGQFLVVPGNQLLLDGFGWSATLLVLAAAACLIVPLALGFTGNYAHEDDRDDPVPAPQTISQAVREAGAHRGFWYLNAGFFVCGFQVTFIMTHLPAFVTDSGLPVWLGAASLSLIGLFNIFGSLLCGPLGDRYRKKHLLSGLYLLRSVVIAGLLLLPLTESSLLVFGATMGFLWLATVPLTSGLVGDIFGVRYMTTLFGIVFLSHQMGAFLGVWLGGLAYDLTGSYDQVWLVAFTLGLLAAVLHWPIADRPVPRLAREGAART